MRSLRHIIFLCKGEDIDRFSYLDQCTFNVFSQVNTQTTQHQVAARRVKESLFPRIIKQPFRRCANLHKFLEKFRCYYVLISFFFSTGFMRFFISNTFISNARLKLAKNQVNAKQHPEAEILLFENYSHYSSTLSSKNSWIYSTKQVKEQVCLFS